jgi:hypothetical protein
MQRPQSVGQLEQVSPALHVASPHRTQRPQSVGQLKQSSPALHSPSPHVMQRPQSPGQLRHDSESWQVPSPQVMHVPQSEGQLVHDSSEPQVPSPQPPHVPQSSGHVEQLSESEQIPLPHTSGCASGSVASTPGPASMPVGGSTESVDRPQPTSSSGAIKKARRRAFIGNREVGDVVLSCFRHDRNRNAEQARRCQPAPLLGVSAPAPAPGEMTPERRR